MVGANQARPTNWHPRSSVGAPAEQPWHRIQPRATDTAHKAEPSFPQETVRRAVSLKWWRRRMKMVANAFIMFVLPQRKSVPHRKMLNLGTAHCSNISVRLIGKKVPRCRATVWSSEKNGGQTHLFCVTVSTALGRQECRPMTPTERHRDEGRSAICYIYQVKSGWKAETIKIRALYLSCHYSKKEKKEENIDFHQNLRGRNCWIDGTFPYG